MSNGRVYIVAGNYEEFKAYVRKHARCWPHDPIDDIVTRNPLRYVYVHDRMTIMGLVEINGFYIGTWRERPDIEEIQQVIAHIKQRTKLIENMSDLPLKIEDIHEN